VLIRHEVVVLTIVSKNKLLYLQRIIQINVLRQPLQMLGIGFLRVLAQMSDTPNSVEETLLKRGW
jgi:hypothetical protein